MGLSTLNTYSQQQIEFTDNRPADVIFTVPIPSDQPTITTTNFEIDVFRPYDIIEIIQPDFAQVTYSIDVSGVSGTTVTWDTIPTGSTVTVVDGVYTIDGIDDLDEWDTVKDPTITIPSSFNGSFFYTVSINYSTSQGRQIYAWQVGTYVPQALLAGSFTLAASGIRLESLGEITIVGGFTFRTDLSVTIEPAVFPATTSLTAVGDVDRALEIQPRFITSTMTTNATVIHPWSNIVPNGETTNIYRKNAYDVSFPNDGGAWPSFELNEDVLPNYTSIRTVLTVNQGLLNLQDGFNVLKGTAPFDGTNYNNPNNLLRFYSGSSSVDVTYFPNQPSFAGQPETLRDILFFPPYNATNDIAYNLKIYIDGNLRENYDGTLRYFPTVNADEPEGYIEPTFFDTVFNLNSTAITNKLPSAYSRSYHNRIDLYVIGAGGGGSGTTVDDQTGGGGGDGGNTAVFTGISFNPDTVFTANMGTGGTGGLGNNNGGAGGDTTVTIDGVSYTATGGAGGQVNGGVGTVGANRELIPGDIATPEFSFDDSTSGGLAGRADNGFGIASDRGAGGNAAHLSSQPGNTGGDGMVFYRTYRA